MNSGREAKENAGENGDAQREKQHVHVHRDARFIGRVERGHECGDGFRETNGEEDAENTAADRKQDALREQLA